MLALPLSCGQGLRGRGGCQSGFQSCPGRRAVAAGWAGAWLQHSFPWQSPLRAHPPCPCQAAYHIWGFLRGMPCRCHLEWGVRW